MAEAEEGRLNLRSQNPLLINEVAKRILQFVPAVELKACRLVCQLWWKESLARWRRTHWLHLSSYDSDAGRPKESPHQRRDVESDQIRMRKCLHIDIYISVLEDPLDPYKLRTQPFQKFKLFKSRLAFKSGKNGKLERFLTITGASVKFLAVESCTMPKTKDFRRIIFRFAPNLEYLSLSENVYKKAELPRENQLENLNLKTLVKRPSDAQSQLKYLKLGMVMFDTIPEDTLPLTWTEFFAHFPNVQFPRENLEFVTLNDRPPDIESILESIHALRAQCGILQQIRGLDLLNLEELTFDRFIPLRPISIPLTFLSYDLGYENDDDDMLQLGVSPATLETLVIYKGPFSAPFGSFPYGNPFPSLTKLTLVGPIVNDLRFMEQMPSLKILRLFHDMNYDHQNAAIQKSKVIKQLQTFPKDSHTVIEAERVAEVTVIGNTNFHQMSHLRFPNMEEFLVGEENSTAEHVKQLARLMPNVKRLRIGLDNEGFRAICKYWKGLEALDIHPAHINDEGITGILPGEETRLPNITDLKYLKAFGLSNGAAKSEEDSQFSDLTDLSLEQGLLQLKYLERVVVWCSLEKMSEENYQKFKSMFPPYPYCSISRDRTSYDSDFDNNILSSDADSL